MEPRTLTSVIRKIDMGTLGWNTDTPDELKGTTLAEMLVTFIELTCRQSSSSSTTLSKTIKLSEEPTEGTLPEGSLGQTA